MAIGRTTGRLVDNQAYQRSLYAGYAGRPQQSFFEKELFGVDTRPDYLRPDRRAAHR